MCEEEGEGSYRGGWEPAECPEDCVGPGNAPYGTRRLLLQSREPLLTRDECATLVRLMEAHGAAGNWDQRYPVGEFTRECRVSEMPAALELLNRVLARRRERAANAPRTSRE